MVRGGGLSGSDGYDDSVYYAAATALIHGHLPYRDFVLLHPPGLIVALTPFAALAQLVSDRVGQDIARLAFMALGALNTVLVMRLGNRYGSVAGVLAGLVYALSFPALYTERTTTLEGLGNTTVLVALTLLVDPLRSAGGPDPRPRRRWHWPRGLLVGAGVALGAGAGVKIWGVIALAVVAVWVVWVAGRRAAGWLVGSAGATLVGICLPFFLAAPGAMWRNVVLDQLGRPRNPGTVTGRFVRMAGLQPLLRHAPELVILFAMGVVVVLVVLAAAISVRRPGAPVLLALLIAHAGVLLASPNIYLHYTTLVAAPAALILGLGAEICCQRLRSGGHPALARVCLAAMLVAVLGYAIPGVVRTEGKRLSPALAEAAVQVPGCITADDPTYLIAMNVLSRNLAHGCPVWIDPTGMAIDSPGGRAGRSPGSVADPTLHNTEWRRSMMNYLLSGEATMVARQATRLDPASHAVFDRLPVIVQSRGFALRQVR